MANSTRTLGDEAELALYTVTATEITRYRDREWQNLAFFSAGLAAVIGMILTHGCLVRQHGIVFDIVLAFLAIGNVFYTCFVHTRLTMQRGTARLLEKHLGLDDLKVDGILVLRRLRRDCTPPQIARWTHGFWSHLLPFFIADGALALFGMWLIHCA